LIRRNWDAEPREEAVRLQVKAFREGIKKLVPVKPTSRPVASSEIDSNAVAKLFEEIKVMFRDLPGTLQGQINENLGPRMRRRRRMHPEMLMDLTRQSEIGDPSLVWLLVISNFRDDAPWLYEVGLDVYHALQRGDGHGVARAIDRLERVLSAFRHGPMSQMIDSPEMDMAVHELGRMAQYIAATSRVVRTGSRAKGKASPPGEAK
jgi:hypothetical protein